MALKHFLHLERQVRIGGNYYTVAPLSVVHFTDLLMILWGFKEQGISPFTEEGKVVFFEMPLICLKPFASLCVREQITAKDMDAMTLEQFKAIWRCVEETNDLDFILANYKANEGKEGQASEKEDLGVTIVDIAFALMLDLNGAYKMNELLRLPMQEFLALLDERRRLRNLREKRPADQDPPTEDEQNEMKRAFALTGIEAE